MTYDEHMQKMLNLLSVTLLEAGLNVEFGWKGEKDVTPPEEPSVVIFLDDEYVGCALEDGQTPLDFLISTLEELSGEVFSTDYRGEHYD